MLSPNGTKLFSYIHFTTGYRQYCQVGDTASVCRLGLFQDADFPDLADSKSTSESTLCILGRDTFVPINLSSQRKTAASHSSTEAEIISSDAGSNLDGIPALNLWDTVTVVLGLLAGTTNPRIRSHS